MALFTWRTDFPPQGIRVTQVFAGDGRVLLHAADGKVSLPGGTPEPGETTWEETLRREVMEEVTCDISKPIYLGYQQVDEQDGTPPYAQIRMVAAITHTHPIQPDPATGRTATRTLVHPAEAARLLNWGDIGDQQLADATNTAHKNWQTLNASASSSHHC